MIPKTSPSRHQNRAFTLIELLVVVAIIGLLISILVPSLSKAKEKARQSACLSNLHHLGQAFQQYLHDNGDNLPVAAMMPSIEAQTLDPNDRRPPITELLEPYARVQELFRCPSDLPGKTTRDTEDPNILGRSYWETEGTSYEYNNLPSMVKDISELFAQRGSVNVGDTVVKITPPPPDHFRRWLDRTSDLFLLTEYDVFHGKKGFQEFRHTLYADFHVEKHRHFPFEVDPNDPWEK
jgi:prepilin-type N-terminal cleavage/methylation domain-containing protein